MQQLRRGSSLPSSAVVLGLALLAGAASLAGVTGARAQGGSPSSSEGRKASVQRLVMAAYHYSYQGDPRKPVPFRDVRDAKGLNQLTHRPWESVGPWMSFDRAQWHKNQFQMMAAGGIDVALAVYRGDKESRRAYALKGLDVMTQGLKELREEGLAPFVKPREYPQIGMALDLRGLADQYGGPVDLKNADVQRSLYGMVRDFFLHIPEEFRATVQLPPSRLSAGETLGNASTPQGAAYVVRLVGDAGVADADPAFISYANRRFAQEFGARLVWIGTPALKAKVTNLDAVSPFPAGADNASVSRDGWISTASLGPGYDDSSQRTGGTIRPRENGQRTVADFRKVMEAEPDWIFIDSWNDYLHGTEIAPTLEYGLLYRDLVRAAVLQYKQSADYAVAILKAQAPRVMQPGVIYQVDVVAQNAGTADWDAFNVAALSYRWFRNGEPVGDPGANVGSNGQVRGEAKSYMIGVAAPMKDGKPLPAGEYELEFNMTRRSGDQNVWFDPADNPPLRIPVTVGKSPAAQPYWITSSMTTLTRRGAAYPAQVRLRNDGAEAWKKGEISVGYRWRKVGTYLKGVANDSDTVVAEGKRVPIEQDVAPGRMLDLEIPVSTTDTSGQPLQTWNPQEDWVYVLEWDLYQGDRPLSAAGGAVYRETVEVLDRDTAPYFVGCSLATELVAGRTEKVTVGLFNNGPDTWQKDRDKVIVHWYYMDGTEASWNDAQLPLQEEVPPFSRTEILVPDTTGGFARDLLGGQKGKEKEKKGKKKDEDAKDGKDAKPSEGEVVVQDGKRYRKEILERPTVLRDVPINVPYYFGPMYCVLDFQHDGLFASTSAASKGNDILVLPVNVYSPTFMPVPLAGYFNVDGLSQDVDRRDGNIDGRGNSMPAEQLPPYVNRPAVGANPSPNPLYPSGLWVRPLNELKGTRSCFMYPSKENGLPNMVQCAGQGIQFPPLQRTAVHFLAVSTEEDVKGDFTLYYADGTKETKEVTFTHWNEAPKHGEKVGFSTTHRHTPLGDDTSSRCYINHYTLPTDSLKGLVGVSLPQLPAVKIVGLTLESATLRR